jgi:hypothetical protein
VSGSVVNRVFPSEEKKNVENAIALSPELILLRPGTSKLASTFPFICDVLSPTGINSIPVPAL